MELAGLSMRVRLRVDRRSNARMRFRPWIVTCCIVLRSRLRAAWSRPRARDGRRIFRAFASFAGRGTAAPCRPVQGTPVVFALQKDGSLRVSVPLRYSFDHGRHAVKPPLGAVLERVAKSQRGEPTRLSVIAPADPGAKGLLLATERASSARDYMVARGVPATRFSISAAGAGDVVIVVAEAEH